MIPFPDNEAEIKGSETLIITSVRLRLAIIALTSKLRSSAQGPLSPMPESTTPHTHAL
jgi:hypothetical protein